MASVAFTALVALAVPALASADYGQVDLISQGNGTSYGQFPLVSADGSRVIFPSLYALVPGDTDSCAINGRSGPFRCQDIYERSGGVTTLLSTGPTAANGDFDAQLVGASSDGSRVFFLTNEPLVSADTDSCAYGGGFPTGCQDLYERSGGVTTLVSTGPAAANGDYAAYWAGASPDGSHVFFVTPEPLVSGDADSCGGSPPGCEDVYDRSGGTTTLVSTGPKNPNADIYPQFVGAAADGSHVVFSADGQLVNADHDSSMDLYDRSGGTTTLLSTGSAGGNGAFDANGWHVSSDGARVVFTTDESLVSADTDSQTDMYEHAGGVTTLVSTGPAGGNGPYYAGTLGNGRDPLMVASDVGTRIFFSTRESLVAADTDNCPPDGGEPAGCSDIYERTGGQTTLVSTGPIGANTNNSAVPAATSADGTRVYFTTSAPLSAADVDSCDNSANGEDPGCEDVYERSGGQTTFISTSPAGDGLQHGANFAGATPDGTRVFFGTSGAFVPTDQDSCPGFFQPDGCGDIYVRAGGSTSLVPAIGGNGPYPSGFSAVSQDGSRVFFVTQDPILSSDSGESGTGTQSVDIYSATLTTGYARPKGATPSQMSLVVAYQRCASPNASHGSPLAFSSCKPPVQASGNLTVGSFDANGAAANSRGYVRLQPLIGDPAPPDDSDLLLTFRLTDVRCRPAVSACGDSNAIAGPDYTGELATTFSARITDKFSGDGANEPATVADTPLSFNAACAATASTGEGGLCSAATSLNALIPGAVRDGGRAIFEAGQVRVFDGGPDGQAASGPNDVFAVQGVFVP